jgi:hypothetical protein
METRVRFRFSLVLISDFFFVFPASCATDIQSLFDVNKTLVYRPFAYHYHISCMCVFSQLNLVNFGVQLS